MNIRQVLLSLTFVLSLFVTAGCGGGKGDADAANTDFEIRTVSEDTVCMLFGGKTGPKCDISYSLKYADGNDAAFVNRIITHRIFQESGADTADLPAAVTADICRRVDGYKKSLRSVTKKSIAEGKFPAESASYKLDVDADCDMLDEKILVYTVSYQEQAYGDINPVENEFSFNISCVEKAEITTDDIFVPGYKDRLVNKIVDNMAAEYKVSGLEALRRRGIFNDGLPYTPDNFIIGKDDITFVYNPFEVAGRKYGIIRVVLKAEDIKDIMKKDWYAFFGIK